MDALRRLAVVLLLGLLVTLPLTNAQGQAPAGPQQIHLGLDDGTPGDSLVISWYQAGASQDATVTVTGPEGDRSVEAEAVPGPAAGVVYEAVVDGLQPGTSYTYTVEGRQASFTTPDQDLPEDGIQLVALGDMGISQQAQATVDTLVGLGPELVLHMGDLSYAEGNQAEWNRWFEMIEPVANRTPWLPAIGNHETLPPVTEVAYYLQRFALPGEEHWYSFDWAGVHIVALDTYSQSGYPYTGDQLWMYDEQVTWLEEDLAEHSSATWTIVFLHEAPYSSNSHGQSERVQEAFIPLFEEHGVDLVLAGHDHGYERTYPMLDHAPQSVDPDTYTEGEGVVYVVSGAAGQSLYDGWTNDPPDWSAARESFYHVFELTATDEALTGRVVPTAGDSFQDSFRIVKPAAATDPPGQSTSGEAATPAPGVLAAALALAAAGAMTLRRRR